jgi:hypothetical protein
MGTSAIPSSSSGDACTALHAGGYNKPLHVIAVLVIFTVSSSGAMLPILATRFPRLKIPQKILFLIKHFGTGVLIATSFWYVALVVIHR